MVSDSNEYILNAKKRDYVSIVLFSTTQNKYVTFLFLSV